LLSFELTPGPLTSLFLCFLALAPQGCFKMTAVSAESDEVRQLLRAIREGRRRYEARPAVQQQRQAPIAAAATPARAATAAAAPAESAGGTLDIADSSSPEPSPAARRPGRSTGPGPHHARLRPAGSQRWVCGCVCGCGCGWVGVCVWVWVWMCGRVGVSVHWALALFRSPLMLTPPLPSHSSLSPAHSHHPPSSLPPLVLPLSPSLSSLPFLLSRPGCFGTL
jgi:hypothetical protein